MSGRWEPKCGEDYYFIDAVGVVSAYVWRGTSLDRLYYESGNCFKTEAAAEAAAEKVKALLLSLHYNGTSTVNDETLKNKPLPKLTAEVFDRPDCPAWAKYAAVDECGYVRLFSNSPWLGESCWNWSKGEVRQLIGVKFDASNWQKSRIKRPEKENTLPKWVEVGGYVFDPARGYGKIISGSVNTCHIQFECMEASFLPEDFAGFKQARLRPYNAEEMPGLIGKVVSNEHGHMFLVTAFVPVGGGEVCVDGVVYNADDLFECYTINGKPCGVLEHLNEKGEWVE